MLLSLSIRSQVTDSLILKEINEAKSLIESNVPNALDVANSAFINSRDLNFDFGISESYLIVGRCYIQTADYEQAQKSLNIALKYAKKIKDQALISDCYFYLGKACFITGNIQMRLSWFNKSFTLRKALNDQKRLADSYHTYGNICLELKQDSLAESYFNLSKNIRLKMNDLKGLASIYNNLAIIAGNRKNTLLYRSLLFEAIRMNEQMGNMRNLATNNGNLGLSYFEQGNYDSAWYYSYLAFEIRKKNDFKDHLAGTYTDLGDILFAQKRYALALPYYKQGAEVAKSISGTEWMIKNYLALVKTYAVLDSTKLQLKYKEMADSINKERKADTLLTEKIPPPPAFDFADPESKPKLLWYACGIILLGLTGFIYYKRKR